MEGPFVIAVAKDDRHAFSKPACQSIRLIAGLGVEGDAHSGKTVKHRSRVAIDPAQPNLRQIHLIHEELHQELRQKGFDVGPGLMGENITTRGIDLLGLPRGTILSLGSNAQVEVTGLRNPCKQLDAYQQGLLRAVLDRTTKGELVRKAGIMGIVLQGGDVSPGDPIGVTLPQGIHHKLERV